MIGKVCQCEVSTLWRNARRTLVLMRFYQFRYSIGGTVRGQVFRLRGIHFSQIVGGFDRLRMWLLVLDVIAARVIPVTRNGMFLRLVIATVQSSEGENKHMCVRLSLAEQAYLRTVWCLPRVQACTMLGLGFTSYTPHGYFWSSALYGNTLR